jgi:hypothetical protein
MLAAMYGVSMALHVDVDNPVFITKTLPQYARRLYEMFFDNGAQFGTTHLLTREYATRIVELAVLHGPDLFTPEELERTKPPFRDGGIREWGERHVEKNRYFGRDSPFRMDFENYALDRLVPDRKTYDFEHEEYRKVRSQILWRIEQLGWSEEMFREIDNSIEDRQRFYRVGSDARKVDRYGKKYSWIAFFEMSGFLHDHGVLEHWRERSSSVDIDPSFPEPVPEYFLIDYNFLGNPDIDTREWVANASQPTLDEYLHLQELHQLSGPWIALDGLIVQEDIHMGRKFFCFVRSFFVSKEDADSVLDNLKQQNIGNRWLPEKPSVIYTFAGEIPWCDAFLESDTIQLTFNKKKEIKAELCGFEVDAVEFEEITFDAIIPVCDFGWEGYQTVASNPGPAMTLAKEISLDLELSGRPQSFDLYSKEGEQVTFNVGHRSANSNNRHRFLFIKEKSLEDYLTKHGLALVWAIWGERENILGRVDAMGVAQPEQKYATFSSASRYKTINL